MNLITAVKYADQIVNWLSPYCHRLEIVGSIRRHRPVCNDVDLVVIPKTSTEERVVDMFKREMVIVNHLRAFLDDYIACDNNGASWIGRASVNGRASVPASPNSPALAPALALAPSHGPEPRADAINLLIQLKRCQLDIFCATEATWATLKLCRTGSREHNIWFAQRAKDRGGHWNPYRGLALALAPALEESDLYAALDLPFIDPVNRELNYLRSLK